MCDLSLRPEVQIANKLSFFIFSCEVPKYTFDFIVCQSVSLSLKNYLKKINMCSIVKQLLNSKTASDVNKKIIFESEAHIYR